MHLLLERSEGAAILGSSSRGRGGLGRREVYLSPLTPGPVTTYADVSEGSATGAILLQVSGASLLFYVPKLLPFLVFARRPSPSLPAAGWLHLRSLTGACNWPTRWLKAFGERDHGAKG